MGISVEKAVLQNLLAVILRGLTADFRHIIALFFQLFGIINLDSVDIAHHHAAGGGKLMIYRGAGYITDVLMVEREGVAVGCFLQKVHFFLGGLPQLINYRSEINKITGADSESQKRYRMAHKGDIFGHDFMDVGALYLDDNPVPIFKHGRMNLGDGSRTQGDGGDFCENLFCRTAQLFFYHLFYDIKRKGLNIGS